MNNKNKTMYLLEKFSFMILLVMASATDAYNTVPMSPTNIKPPPSCINCKNFIPQDLFFRTNRAEYGHCRQFYDFHLVTGEKRYEFASIARNSKSMCGTNATYFEERK